MSEQQTLPTAVKKIGSKQVLDNIKAHVDTFCMKNGDTHAAYSVIGRADGIKTGVSQFGEWVAFTGNFEAMRHSDNERFTASQCFAPEPLETQFRLALTEHEEIEFGFTVILKRRDDLKEGYEYLVKPLTQASPSDALANLRNLIPQTKRALTKIVAEAETETEEA